MSSTTGANFIRKSGASQPFAAAFAQSDGKTPETTGTATLTLYRLESDGTLTQYDWADNTFGGTITTATTALIHRAAGLWTCALSTLTGMTVGDVLVEVYAHSTSGTTWRISQYGGTDGDLLLTSGAVTVDTNNDKTGYSLAANQAVNVTQWGGGALPTSFAASNLPSDYQQRGVAVTLPATIDVRNVTGTLPVVTLAATQPNYAPAKAGDAMTASNLPSTYNANVVQWLGVAPLALSSQKVQAEATATVNPQSIADAMTMATSGTPASGSVMDRLAKIPGETVNTVTARVRT